MEAVDALLPQNHITRLDAFDNLETSVEVCAKTGTKQKAVLNEVVALGITVETVRRSVLVRSGYNYTLSVNYFLGADGVSD